MELIDVEGPLRDIGKETDVCHNSPKVFGSKNSKLIRELKEAEGTWILPAKWRKMHSSKKKKKSSKPFKADTLRSDFPNIGTNNWKLVNHIITFSRIKLNHSIP